MNLRQLEYMIKIEEEHSITRAANKLYITQSALNQQLLHLEKELETPLFYRSKTDMQPTNAGRIYLDSAREILRIKKNTYNQIHDIAKIKKGTLSIGFTHGRGGEMFTKVYPTFHQAYPNFIIEPQELSVHKQQELIHKGELDLGFQTLAESQRVNNVEYIVLKKEEIFLVIPEVLVRNEIYPKEPPFSEIDLIRFKHEPFVLMYKESTIRTLVDHIFKKARFKPNILFETSSNQTVLSMINANLCCGIIPEYYLSKEKCPDSVAIFSLEDRPTWDIVASYRKGNYLSEPAKYFIELVKEYWKMK